MSDAAAASIFIASSLSWVIGIGFIVLALFEQLAASTFDTSPSHGWEDLRFTLPMILQGLVLSLAAARLGKLRKIGGAILVLTLAFTGTLAAIQHRDLDWGNRALILPVILVILNWKYLR
jgi:hypothetical protein